MRGRMVMVAIACTAIRGQASACDIEIETHSAELRNLAADGSALPAAVDELLARDPGDLGAHHLRLELAAATPSQLVDSTLWLIDACPDLQIFDGPIAARVRDRRIEIAWQRAERVAPSVRVQRSHARYRYALERSPQATCGRPSAISPKPGEFKNSGTKDRKGTNGRTHGNEATGASWNGARAHGGERCRG